MAEYVGEVISVSKIRFCGIALLGITMAWAAEAPNLASEPGTDAEGKAIVRLRNVWNVAATAWCAGTEQGDTQSSHRSWNCVDSAARGKTVLAPGEAAETALLTDPAAANSWAVIYADGSTAGDPQLLGQMLASRRLTLTSIPVLQDMIRQSVRNGDSPAALETRPQEMVRQSMRRQTNPSVPVWSQAVSSVRNALKKATTMAEAGESLLTQLDQIRTNLEASKPSLR